MFSRAIAFIGLVSVPSALFATGCGEAETAIPPPPPEIQVFVDASDAMPVFPNVTVSIDASYPEEAAPGVAPQQVTRGNSLCHASATSCYPDVDSLVNTCDLGFAIPDSGLFGPDGGPGIACHVAVGNTSIGPVCMPAGLGLNNSACQLPTDCAVGHECVGDGGSGTCHQYCCSGSTACSINEFCDIQPTSKNSNLFVPVCMPEFPCVLLDAASCPANQQCAVVKDDGSTSCVPVGQLKEGELCEAPPLFGADVDNTRCGPGLMCLGPEGSRRCATLCYTANASSCQQSHSATKTCMGALPLFLSPTVGVCQ